MEKKVIRTAIYVFAKTKVSFKGGEPNVKVARLHGKPDHATLNGGQTIELEPGIYRTLSENKIDVTGDHIVVESRDDKDPWPDVKQEVFDSLGKATTNDAVRQFLATKSSPL